MCVPMAYSPRERKKEKWISLSLLFSVNCLLRRWISSSFVVSALRLSDIAAAPQNLPRHLSDAVGVSNLPCGKTVDTHQGIVFRTGKLHGVASHQVTRKLLASALKSLHGLAWCYIEVQKPHSLKVVSGINFAKRTTSTYVPKLFHRPWHTSPSPPLPPFKRHNEPKPSLSQFR